MSSKLRVVLLLLSLNQLVIFSQYNFEMGLSVGAANHFGEIGGKNTEAKGFVGDLLLKQTTPSAGWFARYKITPHFFAYSSLSYVRLSGDDQNSIDGPRFPVLGALWQPRGGTARHDAVAWGYARKCSSYGIDIIEQCEVIGVKKKREKIVGVETTKGHIKAKKVCFVAAGHSSVLADLAGFRLPIESVALQALVSEPIKPIIDCVVMANTVHGYLSQSDKGELVIGGGADGYNNYSQRGSFLHIEETVRALVETFPVISRLRQLRQWGGIVDMTGDRSPIISKTPVDGLYINCGWGTGGFKAIPGSGWATAEMIYNEKPGKLASPFSIDRFLEGRLIDESAAAAVAH